MKLKKLTLISTIALTLLFIFSCAPKPEELIIGTWAGSFIGYENYEMEVMEDGSYKTYIDISGTQTELREGTWSIEGNTLMLMVEKVYDSSAGELQPIEDGDVEELSYTFGVDEDDLGLISLTGGEDANIETLVGEWTAFIKYSEKGSTTMFEETYTLNLTDDGLYELTSEITGGTTNTENGSWEFDKDALELTLDPSNDDAVVYSVEIIGNSFSMSNPDTITLGFVLDKVE